MKRVTLPGLAFFVSVACCGRPTRFEITGESNAALNADSGSAAADDFVVTPNIHDLRFVPVALAPAGSASPWGTCLIGDNAAEGRLCSAPGETIHMCPDAQARTGCRQIGHASTAGNLFCCH
jgi:hypothetical protein